MLRNAGHPCELTIGGVERFEEGYEGSAHLPVIFTGFAATIEMDQASCSAAGAELKWVIGPVT